MGSSQRKLFDWSIMKACSSGQRNWRTQVGETKVKIKMNPKLKFDDLIDFKLDLH